MPTLNQILVIEDDDDASASMVDALELEGFTVRVASDLESALVALRDQDFGLIITDRRLPDGMIEHHLDQLVGAASNSDIVVVTGYSDMQAVIQSFRGGIADYLIKPIMPEDLIARVNRLVDRRTTELKLKRELLFSSRLADTAEAIILVLDFDGRVVRCNRYFSELTGWADSDLVGELWFEKCIFEEDHGWLGEVFQQAIGNGFLRGITNRVCCKDGSARSVRWSNNKLLDENGEPNLLLSIGVDISEVEEANERALRANRLAAIGTTVAALAHESRNAIQRIKAAADVLEYDFGQDADAKEEVGAIQRAANDLSTLLEDVRAYAAPIQTQSQLANLTEIWRRAWGDVRHGAYRSRDAKLVEMGSLYDHQCAIDIPRLEQVFRNLFTNSLDAAQDPVQVTICCTCSSSMLDVTISDNGPGLNDEQASQLFEAFYTTKPTGTGLGMAICKRIIEAHRGTIEIGKTNGQASGQGTTLQIRLPLVSE
ncbi:MAG: ATP-binding protein [Planctomycetota bacterium]